MQGAWIILNFSINLHLNLQTSELRKCPTIPTALHHADVNKVPPNLGLKMLLNYLKHDFNFKDISVFIVRLHVYIIYPATTFQRPTSLVV